MRIPVILLNHNSAIDCRKCVSFLQRQKGVDIEIVVVDNCSSKNDLNELQTLCKEELCTLIENKENHGYNAGNNIGLRYAVKKGYKYALIANPDMEFPEPDYIARVISKMEVDKNIVVCGTDIIDAKGRHQHPLDYVSFWSELFWPIDMIRYKLSGKPLATTLNYTNSRYCPIVSGCCLFVRMSFIKQIGFFDENVFLYCEEPILAHQVKTAGMKLYYMAEAQAVHRHIKFQKGNPYGRMVLLCNSRDYKNKYHSDFNRLQVTLLLISSRLRKWFIKLKL
uniref:glycosyltransferase n=1 Tax=Bacteroides cellulosilyticus TaxID=246787 RepID=UPI003FEEDAF9